MIAIHKKNGYMIQVAARGNKPLVSKTGMIIIEKGQYRHCTVIHESVFEESFEVA